MYFSLKVEKESYLLAVLLLTPGETIDLSVFLLELRIVLGSIKGHTWGCVTKHLALSSHLVDKRKRALKVGLDCLRNRPYGYGTCVKGLIELWPVVDEVPILREGHLTDYSGVCMAGGYILDLYFETSF